MTVKAIRFSPEQWTLVREMATSEGVSAGQFVRDAAVAHAIVLAVERGAEGSDHAKLWLETLATLRVAGADALQVAYRLGGEGPSVSGA
jgi:uncharacterized protein (DUF1778 family)